MLTTLPAADNLDAATPAASPPPEPLSLDEVRLNLRQPPVQQNARLADLIVTAREFVESETDLVLTPRNVTETARELGRWIDLSSWPVTRITAIRYPTAAGMVTLPDDLWLASTKRRPVRVLPVARGWGIAGVATPGPPVEIDLAAGYAMPSDVPMRVRQAMHMLVAHWFANPDAVLTGQRAAAIEMPLGVADLLRGFQLKCV